MRDSSLKIRWEKETLRDRKAVLYLTRKDQSSHLTICWKCWRLILKIPSLGLREIFNDRKQNLRCEGSIRKARKQSYHEQANQRYYWSKHRILKFANLNLGDSMNHEEISLIFLEEALNETGRSKSTWCNLKSQGF